MTREFEKNIQYYKFCLYGFLKNLRFFEPFLILFFLEQDLSFLEIGILYSIRETLINIFEIPSGIIADSIGRKKTLIISFVFYILSFLVFFFSLNFIVFIGAMILFALGDAFRTGAHKAMIFNYLSINRWTAERTNYYGHTRSWSQIGSAISSLLAAGIIFYTGNYKIIFIYSIIPYLLDLILISSYPSYLDGKYKKLDIRLIKIKLIQTTKNFLLSFKNRNIIKSVSNVTSHSGLHKAIKDYLQPVIQTLVISIPFLLAYSEKQKSAIFIGIIYFIIYTLTSIASRFSDNFKSKIKGTERALNTTLYIGLLLTILTGICYHYTYFIASIIFYVMIFLIENIRNPIGVSHISSLYHDDILATALSANSQIKSLFAAIFAPIIGLLADKFGVGIALSSLAILILLTTPLYILRKSK